MPNKRDAELHKGHRQRLKLRAYKYGVSSLSKHEQVELLLMHAIGRRDLNELSHTLINTFGSFNDVVDADEKDLLKINGIGERTVMFLKIFSDFFEIYTNGRFKGKEKIETSARCVEYFRERFKVENNECAYMTLFNKNYEIVKTVCIGKSNSMFEVELDEDYIKRELKDSSIKSAVLFHTHPFNVKPSVEDLSVTTKLLIDPDIIGKISDHIILNKKDFFSFKDSGILEELKMIAKDRLSFIKVGNSKTYSAIMQNLEKDNDF